MEEQEQSVETLEQSNEDVKSQPTVDELQREIDRKEEVIKGLKQNVKKLERQGGSRAEIDSLSRKIDTVQERIAGWMDDLAGRVAGEEVTPQRKSYKDELKAEPKQEVDPAAQRFFDYLAEEGLDFDDDVVQETIKDTQTPQQALKAMKEKVKSMSTEDITKSAQKEIDEKVRLGIEQALKDRGLTAEGATPSGSSGRTFTEAQITNMSDEEYREKKAEILEAQRQGRIK